MIVPFINYGVSERSWPELRFISNSLTGETPPRGTVLVLLKPHRGAKILRWDILGRAFSDILGTIQLLASVSGDVDDIAEMSAQLTNSRTKGARALGMGGRSSWHVPYRLLKRLL